MKTGRRSWRALLSAGIWIVAFAPARAAEPPDSPPAWSWKTAAPGTQGLSAAGLESAWAGLEKRHTSALLVIRHDQIVCERYAAGWSRSKPHYTASMAKALVGGVSLMLAMDEGRIAPDDLAGRFVPTWKTDPRRAAITIRHLATHTSGIEDAEADGLPHDRLTGWKGDFWKRLAPPRSLHAGQGRGPGARPSRHERAL